LRRRNIPRHTARNRRSKVTQRPRTFIDQLCQGTTPRACSMQALDVALQTPEVIVSREYSFVEAAHDIGLKKNILLRRMEHEVFGFVRLPEPKHTAKR
jgi:hypothetical protein